MTGGHQKLSDELFPRLAETPELLLQRLDIAQRRALLLQMDAQAYQGAVFLDDRIVDAARRGFWIETDAVLRRLAEPRPSHPAPQLIFHIGHCGSTLLSRLLAEIAGYMPVREPPALRTIAEVYRELGEPLAAVSAEEAERLLENALYLYSRIFPGQSGVLLKATSDCNGLLQPILRLSPGSRAVSLRIGLEPYLATMLRTAATRSDIDGFARTRLSELHGLIGEPRWRLYELDTVRRAVVGWIGNVLALEHARAAMPERTRSVDFDALLHDPRGELTAIAAFLGVEAPGAVERALAGGTMSRYSKDTRHRYDAAVRDRDLQASRSANAAEIRVGLDWADGLLADIPALTPLQGLINPP